MSTAAELPAGADSLSRTSTGKVAMWLFLASDVYSFFALLLAYGVLRLGKGAWRPEAEPSLAWGFAAGLTAVLLLSSGTLVLAQRALPARRAALAWLAATGGLGLLFLAGQAWEYALLWRAGLVLGGSHHASTFYAVTGFHGLHVLAGVLVLGVAFVQLSRGRWGSAQLETAGLFWHFVDVAWLCVVAAVYLASWPAVALSVVGLLLFFGTHLWRAGPAVRWGLLLVLGMPGLYALGVLLEAWGRGAGLPGGAG